MPALNGAPAADAFAEAPGRTAPARASSGSCSNEGWPCQPTTACPGVPRCVARAPAAPPALARVFPTALRVPASLDAGLASARARARWHDVTPTCALRPHQGHASGSAHGRTAGEYSRFDPRPALWPVSREPPRASASRSSSSATDGGDPRWNSRTRRATSFSSRAVLEPGVASAQPPRWKWRRQPHDLASANISNENPVGQHRRW